MATKSEKERLAVIEERQHMAEKQNEKDHTEIKSLLTELTSDIKLVVKNKLDKKIFDDYIISSKDNNKNWVNWIPQAIMAIAIIISFFI